MRSFLCAALLSLAACGGSAPSGLQTTSCLFSGYSQLIYPAPGATGVPDAPGQIVFATSQLFPGVYDVLVSADSNPAHATSGTAAFFAQISQGQVPSPSAAVTISNPYFESASTPATFAHGTYYVYLNDSVYACIPSPAGSFTTQ